MAMNPRHPAEQLLKAYSDAFSAVDEWMDKQMLPTHVVLTMDLLTLADFLKAVSRAVPADWLAEFYGVKPSDIDVLRRGNYKLIVEDPK